MKYTKIALICFNLIFAIQAMDVCDHKQTRDASPQQAITHDMHNHADNPTFMQAMAEGAFSGAINHACGIKNNQISSLKEAAVGGAVQGTVQGLRRAYAILRHLQS